MKKLLPAAFASCLFLLIVGAKWATFDRFGSPMPDWDQWDAEALELLVPWFEQKDFFTHLFHPHNEHRVILTKLQNLGLVLINGQWDSRLEAVTNAMLHSALAVAFWIYGRRWIVARRVAAQASPPASERQRLPAGESAPTSRGSHVAGEEPALLSVALFLLTFVLFGLPLAWQNVLGGFHSQQYWLLGLSFAAIVTLPFARKWSGAWWIGALAAVLALGSMGSGFLTAAVVLVLVTGRTWRGESKLREVWPTLALSVALIAIGAKTRVEVDYHQQLKAKTAHDFIFSILRSLEWPLRDHDWTGAILWLPWVLVAWWVLRPSRWRGLTPSRWFGNTGASLSGGRPEAAWGQAAPPSIRARTLAGETPTQLTSRAAQTIAALGGWVLVQIVATAYARGAGADYPASRYMDTLAFGAMVNGVALAWLLRSQRCAPGEGRREKGEGNQPHVFPTLGSDPSPFSLLPSPTANYATRALALIWLAVLGLGLRDILERNLRHELPDAKKYYVKAEGHMQRYLATNDPKALAHPDIPFPSAEGLIERLSIPRLRALMPLPIRAPVAVAPAAESAGFLENDARAGDPERPPRHGLSPATPPLDAAISWGSFTANGTAATGTWKSAPLVVRGFGWLKFETAGHVAPTRDVTISLALHDAETGALLRHVYPTKLPGNSWRAAYVRAPHQPFVIVAHDRSAVEWLAFSPPVEMGTASYWAWRAAKHGMLIVYVACGVTGVLAFFAWLGRGTRHP